MSQFVLTIDQIIAASGGKLLQGDCHQAVCGIGTDSRKIEPGQMFVALPGENFNGHRFVETAITSGATAVLVMEKVSLPEDIAVIQVSDTLIALGLIARFYRQQFQITLIGITGSNGKTTTKDLIAAALTSEFSIIKTEGNFNNEIGLPLTLFNITPTTQVAVVEMGMRGLGEIRQLAEIAKPTIGVITNIGLTHLELLGSQQNIAAAKAELVEAIPAHGLVVLNGDDPMARAMQKNSKARTVLYGIETAGLQYRATEIRTREKGSFFKVCMARKKLEINIPAPGRHNVLNALAAIAVAKELGVNDQSIQKGIAHSVLSAKRLNRIEYNGWVIIDDTYNASPTSVKAALDVLANMGAYHRQIAVLGDMLELGSVAASSHYEIGVHAGQIGICHLFGFGEMAIEFVNGINDISQGSGEYFSNKTELIAAVKKFIQPGDAILVKGSRGMKMEQVVQAISGEEVH